MPEPILTAMGVRKEYFRKGRQSARMFDAVSSVGLELVESELVVLRGRSGSGKTTLLNILGGLLPPTEGCVLFNGRNLYEIDDAGLSRLRNEHFGIVPQGQTALYSLSVIENVMIAKTLYGKDPQAESKALDLLEALGIAHLADSMPSELSGGELRRMSIARALIHRPSVILADEPTGDLDDENTQSVMELLREESRRGAAVVVATHEQIVESYADSVVQMSA